MPTSKPKPKPKKKPTNAKPLNIHIISRPNQPLHSKGVPLNIHMTSRRRTNDPDVNHLDTAEFRKLVGIDERALHANGNNYIHTIKDHYGLTDYNSQNLDIRYFNRHKVMDYSEFTAPFWYVFITRPDLNIATHLGILADQYTTNPYMRELMARDSLILESLSKRQTAKLHTPFLNVFTKHSTGYQCIDDSVNTIDVGATFFGHKITYGINNDKDRAGKTFSLELVDNNDLIVYHTLRPWVQYIHDVSGGAKISPKAEYRTDMILDYAVSLYYFLVDVDGTTIKYWEKLAGVFPTTIPDSSFSAQSGEVKTNVKHQVTFNYSIKDNSMNPVILSEFNNCYDNHGTSDRYVPVYDTHWGGHAESLCGVPFVEKTGTGATTRFMLRWRPYSEDSVADTNKSHTNKPIAK
jgi:hypothetical protein